MHAIFVRNSGIIQGTGLSFAAIGTMMHFLNLANLVTPTLNHTWSMIAIAGFFMTASIQLGKGRVAKLPLKRQRGNNSARTRNDVSLP